MSDYKSIKTEELTKIANAIRYKTGKSDKISLEAMAKKIREIEGGVSLPELENEGSAADLLSGKQLIDSESNIVEGTIATKTASNLTASGATVTVPAGYYASQATKSVATATQATPSISVNSSGLITATATQTAGYVAAGTKSATSQLAFQAAKTITPTTVNQTAVSSGYYTGGVITVKGDSNLVPSNIVSGKSIFGVVGTATTGGSDPFVSSVPFTYTVNAINGASYGFAKNSNGYYESQNKGQNSTYAICRVNFNVTKACDIVFDVINYAENNYDYALFGNLNSALALSSSADSSVKKSFKGVNSASVVNVTYSGVTVGNHYIDIKFIKDSSQASNNDSVQFKVQEQGSLPQETINKILAADGDLVAENIKSGVDIFGVVGTYEGSGGGDTSMEDGMITRIATSYMNSRVTKIGDYAFCYYSSLTTVSFPEATVIGSRAFYNCSKLTTISFPKTTTINCYAFSYCSSLTTANFPEVTVIESNAFYSCSRLTTASFPKAITIGSYAFVRCHKLATISFPKVATIGGYAFSYCYSIITASFPSVTTVYSNAFTGCSNLATASFPKATVIGNYAFYQCYNLKSLYLTGSSLCRLSGSSAFNYSPIGGYLSSTGTYGSIYVPSSLLTSYKNATNWAYFSSRFVGI